MNSHQKITFVWHKIIQRFRRHPEPKMQAVTMSEIAHAISVRDMKRGTPTAQNIPDN